MISLVFDTETTGIPNRNLPMNDDSQPHIVQLAAILADDEGNTMASMNVIIKPAGWTIPDAAANVHGITNDIAEKYGISINLALVMFMEMFQKCDYLVAHNIEFDLNMLRRYAKDQENFVFENKMITRFDTMKMMIDECKLPLTERQKYAKAYNSNIGDYKQPTLSESYWHVFTEEIDGAHDAMVDVEACKELFYNYKDNEHIFIKGIYR